MDITHTHTPSCWWHPTEARWVCGASAPGTPLVDTRDMLVVHTAVLREFRLLPDAVLRVPVGDTARAAVVDRHLGFVGGLLHHHHEGEDALLWPLLRERVPAAVITVLEDVGAQHDAIEASLARVAAARTAWTGRPDAGCRDELAGELRGLHGLLREHLDDEEHRVLPWAASTLTAAEWDALGARAVATMPKPDLALTFGMFAYEGDPAVLRQMLHAAPVVPRMLLPRIAPKLYARRARQVYGTSRP